MKYKTIFEHNADRLVTVNTIYEGVLFVKAKNTRLNFSRWVFLYAPFLFNLMTLTRGQLLFCYSSRFALFSAIIFSATGAGTSS